MYKYIVLLHVLAATVWTGGHLILAATVLPVALKQNSPKVLMDFEQKYERIGIPSLIILVLTGLHMAYTLLPDFSKWFSFEDFIVRHITIKLILLFATVVFALHARLRLIPNLTEKTLPLLASHIVAVTIISVLFVAVGLSFRLQLI